MLLLEEGKLTIRPFLSEPQEILSWLNALLLFEEFINLVNNLARTAVEQGSGPWRYGSYVSNRVTLLPRYCVLEGSKLS